MIRKATLEVVLTLVLLGMLISISHIQPVEAEPRTWVVDDDGPADFSSIQAAVALARPRDTIYVKEGTYKGPQVTISKPLQLIGENKETTIVDGLGGWVCLYVQSTYNVNITGFTVQNGFGVYSWDSQNVNISGNIIRNNGQSIVIGESSSIVVSKNIVTMNDGMSIFLSGSYGNEISENDVTFNSGDAIWLDNSDGNVIRGNNVSYNGLDTVPGYHARGIRLDFSSSDNIIYHNNFIDNYEQAAIWRAGENTWDDGYPSAGNYWSDYVTRYPDAQELDNSGIWNTPYNIDENNQDDYPLMEPWALPSPIPTTISELKTKIVELGAEGKIDNQGIVNSLVSKLDVAQKLVDKGKIDAAKTILTNSLISQVQSLSGIRITVEAVDILAESAQYIISHL